MSLIHLALTAVVLLAGLVAAGDIVKLDSLVNQCKFMVDGRRFDLCPLFGEQKQKGFVSVGVTKSTPPTVTSNWYKISFDGPLARNESRPADMQCSPGTWMCLTSWNRHQDKTWKEGRLINTIPVAGVLSPDDPIIKSGEYIPDIAITARLTSSWGSNRGEDVLSVRFQGGYYVDQAQFAAFHFICEREHDNTKLSHAHTHDGSHFFTWRTPHACGSQTAVPVPGKSSPPPSPEDPSGEQDFVDGPSALRSGRYWTVLLSTACAISILAYLVHKPPRPLRRRLQQFLKAHPALLRFRVGEGVLVRWAHEDVILDDFEDELVVHGDDVNVANEEEQIPLKPSPRKNSIVMYGATK